MTTTQTDQLSQAQADFQAMAAIAFAATYGVDGRAALKAAADSAHRQYCDACRMADAAYDAVKALRMTAAPAGL